MALDGRPCFGRRERVGTLISTAEEVSTGAVAMTIVDPGVVEWRC